MRMMRRNPWTRGFIILAAFTSTMFLLPGRGIPQDRIIVLGEGVYTTAPSREAEPERSVLPGPRPADSLDAPGKSDAFLLIGPSEIQAVLDDFVFWKSCLGWDVSFFPLESIVRAEGATDRSEQIRNFLRERFAAQNGGHVLLIGEEDAIPFKTIYPDPDEHDASGAVPTDLYYACLDGDWDGDGDGFPGEFGQDGCDWIPDISVGRIPWNDPAVVRSILETTMRYERETGSWKKSALLAGGITNFKNENDQPGFFMRTDGAALMECMRRDLFQDSEVTTLYETQGMGVSDFASDGALSRQAFASEWESGKYGCISWWTHGSYYALFRKWWKTDNGNGVPEGGEIQIEKVISTDRYPVSDSHPPIVIANACDNAWPNKNSLSRNLIRDGCAGIITPTRTSWHLLGWDEVEDGSSPTLVYFIWEAYTAGLSIGESFSEARMRYLKNISAWQHVHNAAAFIHYGDPSLTLNPPIPEYGGLSGRLDPDPDDCLKVRILDTPFGTTTDTDGYFRIARIPAGAYTVRISGPQTGSRETFVEIQNGIMTEVELAVTRIEDGIPAGFDVCGNYPNPFNGSTRIEFALDRRQRVRMCIRNARGQMLKSFPEDDFSRGSHAVPWDALDDGNRPVPSGVYFFEIRTEQRRIIHKMLLIR